ncbi:MAG: FtsH protease activity modulator HflK [Verrucomicrobiota bacterium]
MSAPVTPGKVLIGVIIAFAVGILLTCFYTVPPESQALVLRFGKYQKTVDPGLHFKIPMGVDRVIVEPVRRQLKLEFGFGTAQATNRFQRPRSPQVALLEKMMVTGDLNAALVEWVVQYRIDNPKDFRFNVRNGEETLRDVSESVMREVVGDRTVDEVITIGRQDIETEALLKMQTLINKYAMGLKVDQVQLKDVNPPEEVQKSFNAVNEAQQEKESLIYQAKGEYNKAVPEAKGTADREIQAAHGYATKRINEAEGDALRFNAMFNEFQKAPDVTQRRIYLETLGKVLPAMGEKVVVDEGGSSVLPLLQLGNKKGVQ